MDVYLLYSIVNKFNVCLIFLLQIEETKLVRLRVIGGSGLAKKDIFGAR